MSASEKRSESDKDKNQQAETLRAALRFLGDRAVMVPGAPGHYRDGTVALDALLAELSAARATAERLRETLQRLVDADQDMWRALVEHSDGGPDRRRLAHDEEDAAFAHARHVLAAVPVAHDPPEQPR